MNDLGMTNETVAKRKPRKAGPKPVVKEDPIEDQEIVEEVAEPVVQKSPIPEKKVAKPVSGKKFVFFSSGSAYVTKSGFKFTPDNRIYELEEEEADHLLSLSNFRLPDQIELEEYYKENN